MTTIKNVFHKTIESAKLPLVFLLLIWSIFFLNLFLFGNSLNSFGINPRERYGLLGIIFSPFLHGNLSHILGNSIFFFLLSWIICFNDIKLWHKSVFYGTFLGGLFTWFFGVSGVHIGASGVVFALWGTILGMAIYRKNSFFVIASVILFLVYHTTFIFGLIPQDGISFSGHLGGLIAGFASSKEVYYNKK